MISHSLRRIALVLFGVGLGFSTGCTVLRVDSGQSGPIYHARGIVDGHFAAGWIDNDRLINWEIFGGRSSGVLTELQIWKLFRVEVGVAGLSLSVGPLSVGIGTLFYDPAIPVPIPDDDPLLPDPLDDSDRDSDDESPEKTAEPSHSPPR